MESEEKKSHKDGISRDVRSEAMMNRWQRLVEWLFREGIGGYHLVVSVGSLVVTALAIVVIATQWNINSDFKELLPRTSEAAQAMEEVGDRVGSGSSLFVVIDSPDEEANLAFGEVYAEALREIPEIALAHYHNDKTFFEEHRLLYLSVEDLEELHGRIRQRIREERQQANPLFVPLRRRNQQEEERGDGLIDLSDMEERYGELAHQDYKEYLISDDGFSLTIVVRFVETSTDLAATNALLDKVRRVGEELEPGQFHPEMVLEFGGGLVHRQAEYTSIVDDIQTSALFTIIGLFLVIALYFRRFRAIALVLLPLSMGVLWTLAVAFALYGELTTISVFIFAILLGLGIDFSIHLLNGYDRERLEGREPLEALIRCYSSVGQATVMGATTTFVTFVVLSFAQFRGLSQFGQVAALGVMMSVAAMVVVLPAMILSLQKFRPHQPDPAKTAREVLGLDRWINEVNLGRIAPMLLGLSAFLVVVAAFQIPNTVFEENFRRIGEVQPPWHQEVEPESEEIREARREARRLARAVEGDALQIREEVEPESFVPDREQWTTGQKYTSALRGQQSSTPTLLLLDDPGEAQRLYLHLQEVQARGGLETVSSVAAIYAFLPGTPEEQEARLEVIFDIEETLETDLSFMSRSDREKLEEMRELLDVSVVTMYDLPEWTKRLFREAGPKAREPAEGEEFAFEYLLYVNERIDHMIGAQARRFLGEVQEATGQLDVDVRIGSQSFIYTAMLDEIKEDGARMLAIALVFVFLLLTLFLRSPLRAAVALMPLSIGMVWMLGFSAWFGIKLDFFNVIILPVVIGIGIDDGLHFYHRYLHQGRGSIVEVGYHVGSAVGMTTITSIIGFGGLAVTNYAGLQSIGYLAITGLAAAFVATLLVMPAFLWITEQMGWKAVLPPEGEVGGEQGDE